MKPLVILALGLLLVACATPPVAAVESVSAHQALAAPAPHYSIPGLAAAVPVSYMIGGVNRRELHAVDPTTGDDVAGASPFVLSNEEMLIPSSLLGSDGRHLAVVAGKGESCEGWGGGSMCLARAQQLLLFDLPAWRVVTATLPIQGWSNQLAFTGDGSNFVMVVNDSGTSTLLRYATDTADLLARRSLDFRPTSLNLTWDGKMIVLYGAPLSANPGMIQPDAPRVLVLDAASLEPTWETTLPDILDGEWCIQDCDKDFGIRLATNWRPAIVFSPRLNQLYIVHANEEKLTVVDIHAHRIQTRTLARPTSWFEELLSLTAVVAEAKGGMTGAWKMAQLNAEGTRLAVLSHEMQVRRAETGYWVPVDSQSLVQSIDPLTGRIMESKPTLADSVRGSADARYVFLEAWAADETSTEIVDATTLQGVAKIQDWQLFGTRRIDGLPIILGIKSEPRKTQLGLINSQAFTVANAWVVNRYPVLLTP